jgi:UPF0716 protein FxsA
MFAFLLILLIVLPLAELYVLIQVSHVIGLGLALVLLLAVSISGAWLLKREGVATWRRLQEALRRGEVPTKEATDGALILLGGALLLTPGFISDVVGLVFVLPPTRALVKSGFRSLIGVYAGRRFGAVRYAGRTGKRVYDARVVRTRRRQNEEPPAPNPAIEPGDPT